MPGLSDPETRVSLTVTLARLRSALAPTLTPAPAGIASSGLPGPPRHGLSELLLSQPAVHPSPLGTTDIG